MTSTLAIGLGGILGILVFGGIVGAVVIVMISKNNAKSIANAREEINSVAGKLKDKFKK
jgi:uncharacterized membrane protein